MRGVGCSMGTIGDDPSIGKIISHGGNHLAPCAVSLHLQLHVPPRGLGIRFSFLPPPLAPRLRLLHIPLGLSPLLIMISLM